MKGYDKLSSSVFKVDAYQGGRIVLIRDEEARHAKILGDIFDELCR